MRVETLGTVSRPRVVRILVFDVAQMGNEREWILYDLKWVAGNETRCSCRWWWRQRWVGKGFEIHAYTYIYRECKEGRSKGDSRSVVARYLPHKDSKDAARTYLCLVHTVQCYFMSSTSVQPCTSTTLDCWWSAPVTLRNSFTSLFCTHLALIYYISTFIILFIIIHHCISS